MGSYIHFLAISFGWSLLFSDATVTVSLINSATDEDTLECRSDGIVSCSVNPYAGLISWEIDGSPYATCAPDCLEDPNFPRNYSSTYDVTNGIFNLTIENVNYNDSSTTFKCDDGFSFDSITIEVVPAYSENTTNTKSTDGGKQVEFTTTCVHPGVVFEWFTVKTDDSDRERYNYGQSENPETGECSLDSHCGGVGTVNVASVVMIPTVPDCVPTKERYLGVVVKYKNPNGERTFRFDEIFLFEGPDCILHCGAIIFLIYFVRRLLLCNIGYCSNKLFPNFTGMVEIRYTCILIFGKSYTAYILFHSQKEHYSSKNRGWFAICCCLDAVILGVMICTCTGTIEVCCSIYFGYACFGLVLGLMHLVCLKKGTTPIDNEPVLPCDSCTQREIQSKGKQRCFYCHEFLCKKCTREHRRRHETIIADNKNGQTLKNNFFCSHTKNNVESYCLECQQYLCKWCIINHATHRILRHSQQGACITRCHIFCKNCQNLSIKANAKYYGNSKSDKGFFCKECKPEEGIYKITAIDDQKWQCQRCKDNDDNIIYPVECLWMNDVENICAVCFEKERIHALMKHNPIIARRSDHAKVCALHPGLSGLITGVSQRVIDDNKSYADVLCLVCNEYLCKMCFKQHLDLKQLWLQQHP